MKGRTRGEDVGEREEWTTKEKKLRTRRDRRERRGAEKKKTAEWRTVLRLAR